MRVMFTNCEGAENVITERWLEGMSQDKKESIGRFRYSRDRNTATAAHRLLHWGLKNEYGITACEDGWREGEHGKPYLKNSHGVYFSISHSGIMAMCAIDRREIGADIQMIQPIEDSAAAYALSIEERKAYSESGKDENLFYNIWVLKEAYLKYKGSGIEELKSLTVYPAGGEIISNVRGCKFKLIEGIKGYKAAVCAKGRLQFKPEFIELSKLGDL